MFTNESIQELCSKMAPLLAGMIKLDQVVQKRLYDVDEAATYLGRTPNAVRLMISRGKLRSCNGDGRVMLDVRDLDRWIEDSKS